MSDSARDIDTEYDLDTFNYVSPWSANGFLSSRLKPFGTKLAAAPDVSPEGNGAFQVIGNIPSAYRAAFRRTVLPDSAAEIAGAKYSQEAELVINEIVKVPGHSFATIPPRVLQFAPFISTALGFVEENYKNYAKSCALLNVRRWDLKPGNKVSWGELHVDNNRDAQTIEKIQTIKTFLVADNNGTLVYGEPSDVIGDFDIACFDDDCWHMRRPFGYEDCEGGTRTMAHLAVFEFTS